MPYVGNKDIKYIAKEKMKPKKPQRMVAPPAPPREPEEREMRNKTNPTPQPGRMKPMIPPGLQARGGDMPPGIRRKDGGIPSPIGRDFDIRMQPIDFIDSDQDQLQSIFAELLGGMRGPRPMVSTGLQSGPGPFGPQVEPISRGVPSPVGPRPMIPDESGQVGPSSGPPFMRPNQPMEFPHGYLEQLMQMLGGMGGGLGGMRPMIPPGLQGGGGRGVRPMIPSGYQSGPMGPQNPFQGYPRNPGIR